MSPIEHDTKLRDLKIGPRSVRDGSLPIRVAKPPPPTLVRIVFEEGGWIAREAPHYRTAPLCHYSDFDRGRRDKGGGGLQATQIWLSCDQNDCRFKKIVPTYSDNKRAAMLSERAARYGLVITVTPLFYKGFVVFKPV